MPPANPDFIGREDALAQLHKTLSRNGAAVITQAHAITGLGGVGKSQAALAYCYRHLADHRLIWWLRAEEPATLAADYAGLAEPLGLPELPEQEKQIQAVKRQLQVSHGWLLVLDNAEDPAAVRPYLPGTGGQVLVTSRRADWRGLASTLPLDVLPKAEAVALLLGGLATDPAQQEAATVLAAELGHLPLALAQVRAFVQARKVSIATYRQQLAAARAKVFAWRPADAAYPLAVAQTWQASIDAAAQDCPAARPLLELLAFLAPEAVPRDLLGADPEALPESLRDAFERDGAIEALARFSLLRAETDGVAVHRLVQAVTRDGLNEAAAKTYAETAVRLVNAALPWPPWEHTNWLAMGALLPHALAAADAAERLGAGLEAVAGVLNGTALYHWARAAWAEAEPLYERAIAIHEKALGPEHPTLATRLNNLAEFYRDTARYGQAEPLYERAIAIDEKALGPEHPTLATRLNNLAELYRATGRYAQAEPLYERAIAIDEKALGPEHPTLAIRLNNLALLYRATARYGQAEPLYERAIAIDEKALGPEHPGLATVLNNLAELYRATGRYAQAEPLYERATAIHEKAFGPEHPIRATRLNNLAELYRATGRYAQAEPLYERAIAIDEKAFGPEHPTLAIRLNNLAELYRATGRYAQAEPLYERVIAIDEKAFGPEHPGLAADLNNLAELYRATGRYAQAEPLYERAIAIHEKALGPEHPGLATVHLALLYRATGRYAQAEPLYERAIAIHEKALGPEHPQLAIHLWSLAAHYVAAGRPAEAEPLYRRTLAIFGATLPAGHPHIAQALEHFASLLEQLGHGEEAAGLRAQAETIRERPPSH